MSTAPKPRASLAPAFPRVRAPRPTLVAMMGLSLLGVPLCDILGLDRTRGVATMGLVILALGLDRLRDQVARLGERIDAR